MLSGRLSAMPGGLGQPRAVRQFENMRLHGVPGGAQTATSPKFSKPPQKTTAPAIPPVCDSTPIAAGDLAPAPATPARDDKKRESDTPSRAAPRKKLKPQRREKQLPKRKPTSGVWQDFREGTCERNGEIVPCAYCDHCGECILRKGGNTSGMRSHLRSHHPEIKVEPGRRWGQITEYKRNRIDRALAIAIIVDNLPLRAFEKTGMKLVLKELNPDYRPPSRKYLVKHHINRLWELYHKDIKKILGDSFFQIILDCWKAGRGRCSTSHRGFLGVFLTAITPDWSRLSVCLGVVRVRDHHDAPKLLGVAKDVVLSYMLRKEKAIAASTDNHNTESALAAVLTSESGTHHVRCYAHTLDLAVDDAFAEVPEAASALADAHEIVGVVAARRLLGDAIENAQVQARVDPLNLIQDCESRWNTICLMMERLLLVWKFVETALLAEGTGVTNALRGKLLAVLPKVAALVFILKRCKLASDRMEGNSGTLSQVLPVADDLEGWLAVSRCCPGFDAFLCLDGCVRCVAATIRGLVS